MWKIDFCLPNILYNYLQQKEQEKEIQEKEEEGDRVQCERIGEGGGANVVREDR